MPLCEFLLSHSLSPSASAGVTGTDTPWIDQDWDIGDNQESVLITDYDDANAHSYQAGATSGGKAVNGVNNTSANHSVQQYNFGTSSSASFSNTHSQQYNLGTSTSASASNTHSGPTQVPVDESHYHSGNGQVSSFTHYIHRDDSSSVPATDSGGGSSSMAVTNSTGCFGYDDVFNYSFYGGSQFTCPNDTTDTELIKTYALAVPMATMKNSPAKKVVPREPQSVGGTAPMTPGRNMRTVLDLAQAEAVTDSDSISKASPSHFVLACHALTLAGIQGAAKGDVQGKNFKENATKNAEAVTPVCPLAS